MVEGRGREQAADLGQVGERRAPGVCVWCACVCVDGCVCGVWCGWCVCVCVCGVLLVCVVGVCYTSCCRPSVPPAGLFSRASALPRASFSLLHLSLSHSPTVQVEKETRSEAHVKSRLRQSIDEVTEMPDVEDYILQKKEMCVRAHCAPWPACLITACSGISFACLPAR